MKKHSAIGQPQRTQRLRFEPLESRTMLSVSPWSLANGQLTIHGTGSPDTIELAAESQYRLTINGATEHFALGAIDHIVIEAQAADTVILHDTPGDDTLTAAPATARFDTSLFVAEATGFGTLIVKASAGGVDQAHLSDSPGDDTFHSTPTTTELSGNGFTLRTESFEYAHGYARSGGSDRAELYGSSGDDTLVGRETWTRLTGDGYANRAKFFNHVVTHAGQGTDSARIYGSSGDDYLKAAPTETTISGAEFSNTAIDFDSVTAYAGSGNDWAELVDSSGDDTLHATPNQTTLFAADYTNRAVGFDAAHAYARAGGHDIANLHDSPGDDRYVGTADWGKLIGDAFFLRAKFFDSVHAYADAGGEDTACLTGGSGNETFVGRTDYSRLSGPGYEHRVGHFDEVIAKAGTGNDQATIYDSAATDQVVAESRTVRLTEGHSGAARQVNGFDLSTVRLSNAADGVSGAQSSELDLRIQYPIVPASIDAADYLDAADPTHSIQAAIDALPEAGGVVILPAGTFVLRQGLVLRDGVTLRGSGADTILTRPDRVELRLTESVTTGAATIAVESTTGLQVGDDLALLAYGQSEVGHPRVAAIQPGRVILAEPIAVEGQYDPAATATLVNYFPLIRASWTDANVNVQDIVIENLTVDGNLDATTETWRISGPALIQLANTSNARIHDVEVRNAASGGIALLNGHDNQIDHATVDTVRGHGIALDGETDSLVSSVTVSRAGYATRGKSGDGIIISGSSDIVVEDSLTEESHRYGLHPGGDLNRGGLWRNNVSRENGANGFHFCWDNFDILVTGNVLENNQRHGVGGLGLGGDFDDLFNTVANNVIRGNARSGIEVNGGSDNYLIGNTVQNNSQLAHGRFSGIVIANASFTTVTNNTVGSRGTATQKYGVEEYGTANDNFIVQNYVTGNLEGGIYQVGPTTIVSANKGNVVRATER